MEEVEEVVYRTLEAIRESEHVNITVPTVRHQRLGKFSMPF